MSKAIAPNQSETKAQAETPVETAADKAAKIRDAAEKEWQAVVNARQAYHTALSNTGQINLERAAREMGQSVDKFGYPSFETHAVFCSLAVLQKIDHTKFDNLARIARNAIGTKKADGTDSDLSKDEAKAAQDKFMTGKAKRDGNGSGSKSTVKIKSPRAFDVSLGGS